MQDIKNELYQESLDTINYDLFLKAVQKIKEIPITSRAPLGYSSNTIMLHGNDRVSEVSIRNHSGMYSMLITRQSRRFIFNGGFNMELPDDVAANALYNTFQNVKQFILPW